MGENECTLKEDGYINIQTRTKSIIYHPVLDVIIVFNEDNEVKVLDVHSGTILQTCTLAHKTDHLICGRFISTQEKVIFWDGVNIGLRGDYNGVLMLDTILQPPVANNDDIVRLEMILSEAIIFQQSLESLEEHGVECPSDVSNELMEKIKNAQATSRKGIKAQRWNTICIELPYSSLKLVANNIVFNLQRLDHHIPALAIASAINERLTDLLNNSRVLGTNSGNFQRFLMYSEAARRQTFEKWPHMDYKWALPDQMAQAGFYHQPSITGEDRAMCFTCNVCLVCWEKTDEPWSEHERHSPSCPFVKGEYTQNVPLAITYATSPAITTVGFDLIASNDIPLLLCTSTVDGDVTLWSIDRQLKMFQNFKLIDTMKNFVGIDGSKTATVTAICILSRLKTCDKANATATPLRSKAKMIGSNILFALSVESDKSSNENFVVSFKIDDLDTNIEIEHEQFDEVNHDSEGHSLVAENASTAAAASTVSMDSQNPNTKNYENESFDGDDTLKLSSFYPWKSMGADEEPEGFSTNLFTNFPSLPSKNEDKSQFSQLLLDKLNSEALINCETGEPRKTSNIKICEDFSQSHEEVNEKPYIDKVQCLPCSYIKIDCLSNPSLKIAELLATCDEKNIIIVLKDDTGNYSKLLLLQRKEDGNVENDSLASRELVHDKYPISINMLPKIENFPKSGSVNEKDAQMGSLCIVSKDGTMEILGINTFKTISQISLNDNKFVTVNYCKNLERLCACTENGCMIFYSFRDTDTDSVDDRVDDENAMFVTSDASLTYAEQDCSELDGCGGSLNSGKERQIEEELSNIFSTGIGPQQTDYSNFMSPPCNLLASKPILTLKDLQLLHSLTLFDEVLIPYTAEVPGCWNELVQTQKQRRLPQNFRLGDDMQLTKTWRLHKDSTSWDEHVIEITLPKPTSLGHIDLRFSLFQQCPNPPLIQVTLLKQNTSGFGYRMKGPHSSLGGIGVLPVDASVEFNLGGNDDFIENPVLSDEYLQTHNAEILAGPIELSGCMDMCDQGGLVSLTSPKLFKTRARNFLLHIKTMADVSNDAQGKTRVHARDKGILRFLFPSFSNNTAKSSTPSSNTPNDFNYFAEMPTKKKSRKKDSYIGCDWLHEISIAVRSTKKDCDVPNDRQQRIAMLESIAFLENLLKVINTANSCLEQNIAMDILIWVVTIRMMRFRSPKTLERVKLKASPTSSSFSTDNLNIDQMECISTIEVHLKDLITKCIINGDRCLAHKAVKLVLIINEGVENMPSELEVTKTYNLSVQDALLSCVPRMKMSKHASAIRWFTLMINGASSADTHAALSKSCVQLLTEVTSEIEKRGNLYNSLLGARFGLYGYPFESEIVDIEIPLAVKANSLPNTLANLIKSNAGLLQSGGTDLKKLSSIDGVGLRYFPHLIKRRSISNQMRGLLEVLPLHFSLSSASEATRIENMDSLSSSSVSNINIDDIIVTPLHNHIENIEEKKIGGIDKEGITASVEKDPLHIMNNVKNMLVDEFFSYYKKQKQQNDEDKYKPNGVAEHLESIPKPSEFEEQSGYSTHETISSYFDIIEKNAHIESNVGAEKNFNSNISKYLNENSSDENSNGFSWHKLLTPPPKQMVVVERIHSGARRFVILDFGSPIVLTDLVIPACDELASLFIDVWCFDEESDCVRLASSDDIGMKTLILSDLQPPPICRFMKITIIGRYGLSATCCRIPIGTFYGHIVILENDGYADPFLRYVKTSCKSISEQIKALSLLFEDVHCRLSLANSKLMDLLGPILDSDVSNIAHMDAFFNAQKEEEIMLDSNKVISAYEDCITLQHKLNLINNVRSRLQLSLTHLPNDELLSECSSLAAGSRDKLRVLSECLVEVLLHFSIEYGVKNIQAMHSFFTYKMANSLFDALVIQGDAQIQLATCSLLVRMCSFQSWWGEFMSNIFRKYFSSQNTRIFPQDRIFFLLSYMGRKSIAIGACRSIVIDAILKTLAHLLGPISPHFGSDLSNSASTSAGCFFDGIVKGAVWYKTDVQLITWLLLFLSVCLDENSEKKDKSSSRWEFMSCESDYTKSRSQNSSSGSKTFPRYFKKRIVHQNKHNGLQIYTDWGKKIYMLQNEIPEIFMELASKQKSLKSSKVQNLSSRLPKESTQSTDNSFDKGLKTIKLCNILVVVRGLIGLILEMDFTCNMDLFLLNCKIIGRLVSACKPFIQLCKVITDTQIEHLIRLAVWNDQQHPWAVHSITCLLQDLLDADKQYREVNEGGGSKRDTSSFENFIDNDTFEDAAGERSSQVIKDVSYADTVKYGQLASLIECEDTEMDEFLSEMEIIDRGRTQIKKDGSGNGKTSFNFFCKSISSSMDSRLEIGLDTNAEISIRRLTMIPSLDLYASLPQIPPTDTINASAELQPWKDHIIDLWSGPEYNTSVPSYEIFKAVFDNMFLDLHHQDTWVHLEQLLQLWLTLNSELSDKPYSNAFSSIDVPKIAFGSLAVQGLLSAFAWQGDIKLRTWCLGFQCLILACTSETDSPRGGIQKMAEVIVENGNFEQMLLRFFSGFGMNSTGTTNRCVGPTTCKYLHELFTLLHTLLNKGKKKFTDILLDVVLQLIRSGGAISNQQGPVDAQSQLIRDLISFSCQKTELTIAMKMIESVSILVFNNIMNNENIYCHKSTDSTSSNNAFGSTFATVLGADNPKQSISVSDNLLVISLLKFCCSLMQVDIQDNNEFNTVSETLHVQPATFESSQTDENKAEQQKVSGVARETIRNQSVCLADAVLNNFGTMKRFLGALSLCSNSNFAFLATSCLYASNGGDSSNTFTDPKSTVDAIMQLLMLLCKKASKPYFLVAPIFQYLKNHASSRNIMPQVRVSEPFVWYVMKVFETPDSVAIFTEMGGIKVLCQNFVRCNQVLPNNQSGLISLIMQNITRNVKFKLSKSAGLPATSSSSKKPQISQISEGLINFAPFCNISSEVSTAQPADVLIQTPIASHRRARTSAWSHLFYPNESHVDLNITLPTAVLLKEVHVQPHLPTLANSPSAVAIEISRDGELVAIPFGPPLTTVGMTCIRLKLSKPEIASSLILRLYRPKDSSSIGLTQITILGTTIFTENVRYVGNNNDDIREDDSFVITSMGWLRLLSRCLSVSTFNSDSKLSAAVVSQVAKQENFLEASCSLLNVMPSTFNIASQNLEIILLKLGTHSKELSLKLVYHLLWGTMPQTYRLSNEAVANLLFDLCTTSDNYTTDRLSVLLDWILKLKAAHNQNEAILHCTNPQSGFIKCIASIFWVLNDKAMVETFPEKITNEVFEACFYWIDILDNQEPLKKAFDSLLCSLCSIRPELFTELLKRIGGFVSGLPDTSNDKFEEQKDSHDRTDDTKEGESSNKKWYEELPVKIITKLLASPSYLQTVAISCQSPLAVSQLVTSGLPRLLAITLLNFCCSSSTEIENFTTLKVSRPNSSKISISLTDADKAESIYSSRGMCPAININLVPEILNFFGACCSEGHMRDWLGSYQGSIFWKPLLELLCNHRPAEADSEPMRHAFASVERSTLEFLSKATACHPNNQDTLSLILIMVIKKPLSLPSESLKMTPSPKKTRQIISGFTRRLILQLLLESERILVSVRSDIPLRKKNHSITLINPHPSLRTNSHHLLFFVSVFTKCQDILENCSSVFSNVFPSLEPVDKSRSATKTTPVTKYTNQSNNCEENHKDILDMTFGIGGHDMEFLSVVAGVTAKDKRLKDVKNQAAAMKDKDLLPKFTKLLSDDFLGSQNGGTAKSCFQLVLSECPQVVLTADTSISQILSVLHSSGVSLSTPCIKLTLVTSSTSKIASDELNDDLAKASNVEPMRSPLQRFSVRGGLSLLAYYLPTVYPDCPKSVSASKVKDKSPSSEWVKLETSEEIYEDMEDAISGSSSKMPSIKSVPQHSLAAFGLFLRLPTYSDVLLRDKLKAQCLLRLVLGVTGDGEGNDIYSLPIAPSLPTMPFEVFRQLLDSAPSTTDDGVLLRRMVIEVGALNLVLNCLAIFTHQSQNCQISGVQNEVSTEIKQSTTTEAEEQVISDDKSHVYWAKGTGFGTGSTQQSWDVEQALLRQKSEEEHVTVLLQVLSSYINPGDKIIPTWSLSEDINVHEDIGEITVNLPPILLELLQKSCLISALSSYLRNDSVLDITRHIPLYRSILQLLRALALSSQLVNLLNPRDGSNSSTSIASLLSNMKACVDTYAKRLKFNKKSNIKGKTQKVTINMDDGDDEGLALLIPDIQETAILVQRAAHDESCGSLGESPEEMLSDQTISNSIEYRYLEIMKQLQFDTYEMIAESDNGYRFVVSYHFENNVRMAGDRGHPSRVKRLAQETVTLSTSLPLSYSSSVFVRCDTDRLDVMKVLITGPAETPYANGCFEFDVYFPPDYPNSPMLINLETTGRHSVRFNPNLYNDGKVCLSVLNTWHGRPEEKWNAQTSSFLQVLVSIQSLILVPEPYFNEPGFERSRGTPSGTHCCKEYNSNIYQACVRWAMLEQIRNPSPCFKDVIFTHFWLKRNEICAQIENWIEELSKPQYSERSGRTISFNSMVLRRQYRQLREELAKLPIPEGFEDLNRPFNPYSTLTATSEVAGTNQFTQANTECNSQLTALRISEPSVETSAQSFETNQLQPQPISAPMQEDIPECIESSGSSINHNKNT